MTRNPYGCLSGAGLLSHPSPLPAFDLTMGVLLLHAGAWGHHVVRVSDERGVRADPRVLDAKAEGIRCPVLMELACEALKSCGRAPQGLGLPGLRGCLWYCSSACIRLFNVPGPARMQAMRGRRPTWHACSEAQSCTEVGHGTVSAARPPTASGPSDTAGGGTAEQSCTFMRPSFCRCRAYGVGLGLRGRLTLPGREQAPRSRRRAHGR